jgi:hypothetical protein
MNVDPESFGCGIAGAIFLFVGIGAVVVLIQYLQIRATW